MKMKMTAFALVLVSSALSFNVGAVTVDSDAARSLYNALVQADLKVTQVTDPKSGEVVDQKLDIRNLNCKLAFDQIGTLLGSCRLIDLNGRRVRLGSAASAQILNALPDGFSSGGLGHFTGAAKFVGCEADTTKIDSSGTATYKCEVK